MLERLKILLTTKEFWTTVIGLFILSFRILFPESLVTDEMISGAFNLLLMIILGVNMLEMRRIRSGK